MSLHPDVLKSCAAYIAHPVVYGSIEPAVLRESARFSKAHSRTSRRGRPVPAIAPRPRTDEECDALVNMHIRAIRRYGIRIHAENLGRGGGDGDVAVARAILDACPSLLSWWCEQLVSELDSD